MNKIKYSPSESEILNLKVGRASLTTLNIEDLNEQIFKENFDLCILKVPCNDPYLMLNIKKACCPVAIAGVVSQYNIFYNKGFEVKPYHCEGWDYEVYDGSQEEVAKAMIIEIFGHEPMFYYHVPYYHEIIDAQKELTCLVNYLLAFQKENKHLVLMKFEGEYAGLMVHHFKEDYCECVLTGLLKKFRGKKMYADLVIANENYQAIRGADYGFCGARIHNIASHRTFVKEDLYMFQNFINIYLTPFLSRKSAINETFKLPKLGDNYAVQSYLIERSNQLMSQYFDKIFGLKSLNFYQKKELSTSSNYSVVIAFPICSSHLTLILVKVVNEKEAVVMLGYITYELKA